MSLLLFKKQFLDPIRTGRKRTTIRRWSRPRVRAGGTAFSPGIGYLEIESVDPVELTALNDHDAAEDGFPDARQMRRALEKLCNPSQADGKTWFRIRFRLQTPAEPA